MDSISILRIHAENLKAATEGSSLAKGINAAATEILSLLDSVPNTLSRAELLAQCNLIMDNYVGPVTSRIPTPLIKTILDDAKSIESLSDADVVNLIQQQQQKVPVPPAQAKGIFIGHGRRTDWLEVERHLFNKYSLDAQTFEKNAMAGEQVIPTLQKMLDACNFAIVVATKEDSAEDGQRARQNVVHEIGLCQGRYGFERVAILVQEGVQLFSNLSGMQVIYFKENRIDQAFGPLEKQLSNFGYVASV